MTGATSQSSAAGPASARRDGVFLPEGAMRPFIGTSLSSISNWCEYGVWGMTLHDDQAPWFVLLECFQILHHRGAPSGTGALFPGLARGNDGRPEHENVRYEVPLNRNLRHLLFRDREVLRLAAGNQTDQAALWRELQASAAQIDRKAPLDLSYLPSLFDDFGKFARSIELLRSAEVESFNVKRWTSRHLLPLGRSMLFADVDDGAQSADKRFFRRTGEILYLMLNRSRDELRRSLDELVRGRVTGPRHPLDELASRIAGPGEGRASSAGAPVAFSTGYLPIPRMKVYDRLAEDWIALLSLSAMQFESLLDPLTRLSDLHLIIYAITRSWEEMGGGGDVPPIVFDLTGSARRNPVQRLAADQYDHHRMLPRRAVEAFLDRFRTSPEWQEILGRHTARDSAHRLLKERFQWSRSAGDPMASSLAEPEEQLQELLASFQGATSHTLWSFLAAHARRCGLILTRPGAGTWYAPSDSVLEALVLANVTGPTELGRFLRRLRARYGIVIGAEEARAAFGDGARSLEPFKANQTRLEERLAVLGCIDRKSDDCAFVINPFHRSDGSENRTDASRTAGAAA
jgi:hypothetical protein